VTDRTAGQVLKAYRSNLGREGENLAVDFLKSIGFEVLERNYKYGRKDIDIICRDGKTIVFVEVKVVRSRRFGTPLEKVNDRKQQNISQVAKSFIQRNEPSGHDFRFDVIVIDVESGSRKIDHIRNAFMVKEHD